MASDLSCLYNHTSNQNKSPILQSPENRQNPKTRTQAQKQDLPSFSNTPTNRITQKHAYRSAQSLKFEAFFMESRIYGVPLSAAQMALSNDNISGIRVRAPLTVYESDSNVSSDYSGSESEGFESGEDMLETPRVVEEDEEIVEEAGLVKRVSVSEGAVVGLNGETVEGSSSNERGFVKQSGNASENVVSRPFARIPNGGVFSRGGNFVDSNESLLSDLSDDELAEDEEYVANYSNTRPVVVAVGDEVSEEELTPVVRVPSSRKLSIPIAKISGDSDDDSGGSDILDADGFSGIARAPSSDVLQRIDSSPKVGTFETDEGCENKLQAEDAVEMEIDGNLLANGMVVSPSDEKEPIVVGNSLVQDNGPDLNEETMDSSVAMNDVLNPTSETGHLIHLDEEIKEVDDFKECLELVDHREPANFVEGVDMSNISDAASVAEFDIMCDKLTVHEVGELGSNNYFEAASLSNVDSTSSNTNLEDTLIVNQDNESEIVESIKQEIDHIVESFNAEEKIGLAHECVDVEEVPAELCPEFPESAEAVTESMSDSLFEVAIQSVFEGSELEQETGKEAESSDLLPSEVEHSKFHSDDKPEIVEWDMVQDSTVTESGGVLQVQSQHIDGQVVENFDDEMDTDGGMNDKGHVIYPAALSTGVRNGMSDNDVKCVSVDPFSISDRQNEALSEREKEKIRKIQRIRVKYLCLLDRLGCSPEDYVASKVLYELMLADGSSYSQAFHLDSMIAAMELESHKKGDLDFALSIMIIGKTGVGKSATINSIFGESAAVIDAFEPSTTRLKEFVGLINGVKLKVFDTPGLRTSLMDQSINRKILSSIKKLMKKSPPDVILYVDRVDTQRGDFNDLPLMRLVTCCLGSSIWRKTIVAFTHGASLPPDGPNGYPMSHEAFVAQQSHIIQRLISHSAGEMGNSGLTVPVCVVENHASTEKNGHGETLLHNKESWKSKLMLLCYSMKILSELSSLVMSPTPLSSFFQSSVHREMSNETYTDGNSAQETEAAESTLPPSFDGDERSHRVPKPSSQLLTRPVLNCNDLVIVDEINIAKSIPAVTVQLIKDTKEVIIQLHSSVSGKHGENVVWGLKDEDFTAVGKEIVLVGNADIIQSQDDDAYGVNFELCRRDKDETSVGMSVMRHRGGLIYGCNLNSQISSISRNSKLHITAAFNNRLRGQISVKTNSCDQLQVVALALVPIAGSLVKKVFRWLF